jgi:ATPase family AAA domain-containing protein 3A/B
MMVLATNRAEDLDSAVLDRMDESLYLGLPDAHKRRSLTVIDTLTFAPPFFK